MGATSRGSRSLLAAPRASAGEGEEIIVAEMMDLDEVRGRSALDNASTSTGRRSGFLPRLDDEHQNDEFVAKNDDSSNVFWYDSDSSVEAETVRRRKNHGGEAGGSGAIPPTQLPFPIAPYQQAMYDCQEERYDEEKKMSDGDAAATGVNASSKLSDPPLLSPFCDLSSVSEELKQLEKNSWFLMKFPTRLPLLDTSSSSMLASKKKAAHVKAEPFDENGDPDAVGSSNVDASTGGETSFMASPSVSSSGPLGYDDTLKDTAPGKYGRIVVRRSGKTELIIGGGDGRPKVRSYNVAH
jgi:hypothetical protein